MAGRKAIVYDRANGRDEELPIGDFLVSNNITITNNLTVSSERVIFCDTTSNSIDINLPSASGRASDAIVISKKTSDANFVKIIPFGSEKINLESELFIIDVASVVLISDGVGWTIT